MKRILLSFALVGGLSAVSLLVTYLPAAAGPGFSNRDLDGEYLFILTEIRNESPPPSTTPVFNFCDHAGTLSFNGAGTLTVTDTQRCSVPGTGPVTETFTLNYSVSPDGSFTVTNPDGSLVHGQILNHKRALLFDGTMYTDPNRLIFQGVAMRR